MINQQITAKSQRTRPYEKRNKQYRQNKLFKNNAKQFYSEIGKKQIDVNDKPLLAEVEDFWSKISEDEDGYTEGAE